MFRARRSVLYMPGANERALEKAKSLAADSLILDLEDAVGVDAKDVARENACAAAASGEYGRRELTIRVNGIGTQWHEADLAAACAAGPDGIVVPKVNSAKEVKALVRAMEKHGAPDRTRLWAMIETPRAVLDPLGIGDRVLVIAGSQARFRAVDFDANLAAARMAQAAGARRAALVSAMGANAGSGVFYSRVKGELEDALAALGFDALVIARPSMLRGDRAALGQPVRAGELRWARLDALLRPLIPANYRAIDAADVAAALRRQLPTAQGRVVLPSGAMQGANQART